MVQFTLVLGHPFHFSFDEDVTSASLWLMSAPKLLPLDPALVVFAMVDVRSEASSARSGPRRLTVTSLAR